jgi:hypothetical protein
MSLVKSEMVMQNSQWASLGARERGIHHVALLRE